MIRVTIEVSNGARHHLVTTRAQSIQQALDLVGGRYAGNLRVVFPLDPETFFVKEAVEMKLEELELLEKTTDDALHPLETSGRSRQMVVPHGGAWMPASGGGR